MSTATDCVIMDHISSGHFDRELGAMTRDPQYAEYTAIEIKAVLTDRIADNMLPEHDYGLTRIYAAIAGALIVLLAVFMVACGDTRVEPPKAIEIEGICLRAQKLKTPHSIKPDAFTIRGD